MPFHTNTARQQEKLQFIHLSLRFWTSGRISPYKGLSGIDWKGLPKKVPKTEQFFAAAKKHLERHRGGIATKMKITQAIVRKIFPETAR